MKDWPINKDTWLSTHQVAKMLQVSKVSVHKWVDKCKLPGERTPGGHRRIRADDLAEHIIRRGYRIPAAMESLARRRILVVDDHPQILISMERGFRKDSEKLPLECAAGAANPCFVFFGTRAGSNVASISASSGRRNESRTLFESSLFAGKPQP